MKTAKLTLFICLVLGLGNGVAQPASLSAGQSGPVDGFADTSFYLIDSLLLEYLSKRDKILIDSTLKLYHKASHDTTELNYLAYLAVECWDESVWTKYNQLMYQKVQEILSSDQTPALEKKYLFYLAEALNNIGYNLDDLGDIPEALEYYLKSLKIYEEIGDKKGVANSLNNIGLIYKDHGDIQKGLEYYFKSIKIYEEIGDKYGAAISLNNIGLIYQSQGDIQEALEYALMSLKIREEIGDKKGAAHSLSNIGYIYQKQGDIQKGLEYNFKSLNYLEEIANMKGVATSLNNIGLIYRIQGENITDSVLRQASFQKGLEYYLRSLKITEEIGDIAGVATCLNNIARAMLTQGQIAEAREYAERSLDLAREIGSPYQMRYSASTLKKIAVKEAILTSDPALRQAKYKEALDMYELHIQMRDSINNEKTQKATIRQQTKYEFEKAQLIKEQETKETKRLLDEAMDRRDNLQYSVVLICLLVIGVIVAMLGRLSLPVRIAEGIIFFSFLILFEFILVLADPYIENWSGGAPGFKLLFNAGIAALIFPMHAFFEAKLKGRLVKK